MSIQALTIQLPDGLYSRLQRRAEASHRTLEAELLEVLTNAVSGDEVLSPSLSLDLAHLKAMTDAELR